MANLKRGDRVNCRLKASKIVSPYTTDYDDERVFEIVAADEFGYYLYIPSYLIVKETDKIDFYSARELGIESKFIGEEIIFIHPNLVAKVSRLLDGCFCAKCKNFSEYGEPNQEDGSFICWYCRAYPIYH